MEGVGRFFHHKRIASHRCWWCGLLRAVCALWTCRPSSSAIVRDCLNTADRLPPLGSNSPEAPILLFCNAILRACEVRPNSDSTIKSNLPIYCVLLIWQYIYGWERERNQDSKSYLDSKSSRKSKMNVRETSEPCKSK